jgi:hypothetical protein
VDKISEKIIQWLVEAFKHPLSPLFFILGVLFVLLGVSQSLNIPGFNQLVAETHFRGIAIMLGVICLVTSVSLYYYPTKNIFTFSKKYDVFLSTPMAAYENDEQYKASRREMKKIFDAFQDCGFIVYWASEEIESIADFETKDISATVDLDAVKHSEYFCLIYTEKLVTSSLFEAGYALALNKSSLYFVTEKGDLPFLMRDLSSIENVRIHDKEDWKTMDDIVRMISHSKERIFAPFSRRF